MSDLFQDPTFPPNSRSLNVNGTHDNDVVWKRASEIVPNPKYIVDGASRQDLDQGALGDCWYIASAASLASNYPEMLEKVINSNQGFERHQYTGQFRFLFWWYGKFEEVVIDDFLPTKHNKLIYCKCNEACNELWPALLEKAYAKLHRSYASLVGGFEEEAMVDLTGGIPHTINISKTEDYSFFDRLKRAFEMKTLMSASIHIKKENEETQVTGLITGHAYSITMFEEMLDDEGANSDAPIRHRLLRVRNPWGNDHEWKGEWSDASIQNASPYMKEKLGPTKGDGEFWISFEDFISNFDKISLCYTNPNAWVTQQNESIKDYDWNELIRHGSVVNGATTMESRDEMEFKQNPIQLDLQDSNISPIIISVMKKDCHNKRNIFIGFDVCKAKTGESVHRSILCNTRDVTSRLKLPRGSYYVKARAKGDNECVDFTLRVFTVQTETVGSLVTSLLEDKIQQLYDTFSGRDNKMDGNELHRFLSEMASLDFFGQDMKVTFNIELSRTLHALFDTDNSNFLSINEVLMGCKQIKKCMKEYRCKQANCNEVDTCKLYEMFKALDIDISKGMKDALERRYGGRKSVITAEDFILAVCKVKSLLKSYEKFPELNDPSLVEKMMIVAILK